MRTRIPIFFMTLMLSLILLVFWNSSLSSPAVSTPLHVEATTKVEHKNKLCSVSLTDKRAYIQNDPLLNMIYYVTPTYPRPEQIPELTRLSHTLMHVPRIHWIVAEDHIHCSQRVTDLLIGTGLPFTHLTSPKPLQPTTDILPRGVSNRRAALTWLRENVQKGVLYFGDDDNTVDLQLFSEIRQTKKLSMFPVGLIGNFGVSSPIVKNGKVTGFFDSWPASRTFPVDMAGFAVNLEALSPKASMPFIAGHEEDRFLVSAGFRVSDIEPLANNCSKILVWHTRTSKFKKPTVFLDLVGLEASNKHIMFTHLLKETSDLGMAKFDPKSGIKPFITRDKKTIQSRMWSTV